MKKVFKHLSMAAAVCAALASTQALAFEAGDWIVRAGASTVDPQESSGDVTLDGAGLGAGVGLDSSTQLGLTAEYMFSPNMGLELLAATPFEHTATGTGGLSGIDIADVKHLPPTLSVVYHFDPMSNFQPYLGAGVNYTIFFSEDLNSDLKAVVGDGDVELDDSWGLSFQAGVDYHVSEQWLVNASVRWIDIDTEAKIDLDSGSTIKADIDIDPYVYTLSVGYKF